MQMHNGNAIQQHTDKDHKTWLLTTTKKTRHIEFLPNSSKVCKSPNKECYRIIIISRHIIINRCDLLIYILIVFLGFLKKLVIFGYKLKKYTI
jgi:hypothetical protein